MNLDLIKREDINIGRCKCCLDDVNLLNLWEEYDNDGQTEIFGAMVEECYSFNWVYKKQNEFICNACIKRLRDAVYFKREIIASEQVLQQVELKQEVVVKVETVDDMDECNEVEYLEFESDNYGGSEEKPLQETEPIEVPKPKWPKRRKGADRLRVYKKYTQLELREAMEAVRSGKMTQPEAAEAYNIPRNTLKNNLIKLNASSETKNDSNEEVSNKDRNFKLIEEIKTLLTYTNAIPFKSKLGKYYCAYCSTEGPVFDDGDELRNHTINMHSENRTYNVDHFMRPYWLNEILKLDVNNLTCTLCETKLPDWNGMFQHFSNKHEIEFDEAYTRVVPYIINDTITCVLCHDLFTTFHQIDAHMNAHYNNYICYECGDTFVAASRLEKHFQVHNTGMFPCEECGKVFTVQKYCLKHYNMVHRVNKVKCHFCSEKFPSASLRRLHTSEKHKDQLKEYTCEYCGAVYNYKPNFIKHVQRKHTNINKKNKCDSCDKAFIKKYDLRMHILRNHTLRYSCKVCGETFTKKKLLNSHVLIHENALKD